MITITSSERSTSLGRPNASLSLITPRIHDKVISEAHAIDTSIGGASQNMFCARKHSGTIHAMNGWKNVLLNTLTIRSIESGANHESRCGGVVYGEDMLDGVFLCLSSWANVALRSCPSAMAMSQNMEASKADE